MLKRIISFVLILCTCLTISTPVYAEVNVHDDLEIVPQLKKERNVLQEDVDSISKTNGNKGFIDASELFVSINRNTENNPIYVDLGEREYNYLNAGDVIWYAFYTVESPYYQGVYDIYTTGNTDTYGQLYRKDSQGNMILIDSNDDSGEGSNFKFSYILNGSTVYYVKVRGYSSSTTGSFYFNVERHVDKVADNNSNGGSWIINGNSPIPTVNGCVYRITYLNAKNTRALYSAFNESVYDIILDWCITETAGYAIPKIMTKLGVSSPQAMLIFSIFCLGHNVANTAMKNKIWNASNGLNTGISVTTESIQGSMYYNTKTWSGSMMYGAPGYLGHFDKNDIKIGR